MQEDSKKIRFKRKDVPANAISLLTINYMEEISFFCYIFLFLYKQNVDLSIKRRNKWREGYSDYIVNKKYNETILISLVILKRIKNVKLEKKITNEDLIFIRWCAINEHLNLDGDNLNIIKKTQPNILRVPNDFTDAIEHSRTIIDKDNYDLHKIIKAKKNDFSSYINIFSFSHYKKCIDLLMRECDNIFMLDESLIKEIKNTVSIFLRDIKINRDTLKYVREKKRDFQNNNNSFLSVFESSEINNSYSLTWNRFCDHYPEEIESRFFEIIWKKIQKIKE